MRAPFWIALLYIGVAAVAATAAAAAAVARASQLTSTISGEESGETLAAVSWHDHNLLAARTDAPSRCVSIPRNFSLCYGSQVGGDF